MADRHDDGLPPFAGPEPGPLQFDPDDPRRPDIRRLRGQRLSGAEIARRLGLRQTLAWEICSELGIAGPHLADPDGTRLNRILTLRAHGYTQARIAAEIGMTQDGISKILCRAGYKYGHRRRRSAGRAKAS